MLLELGAGENDEATIAEATAQLPGLDARVRDAELARMLSGRPGSSSARRHAEELQ